MISSSWRQQSRIYASENRTQNRAELTELKGDTDKIKIIRDFDILLSVTDTIRQKFIKDIALNNY